MQCGVQDLSSSLVNKPFKIIPIFIPQLAGKARQLGCPKIVLDHMCVLYIIIYILYKALVHTQPSIVLLPGIHTTMYIF